jgi:hypothetical protein
MGDAGGADRVLDTGNASMTKGNKLDVRLEYVPSWKFCGVEVPTSTVEPNFHKGTRSNYTKNGNPRAIKVIRRAETKKGDNVFVLFDDNIVRQVRFPITQRNDKSSQSF